MNGYIKITFIVFAAALVAGGGVAATSHDPWAISVAVLINIGTTLGALLAPSPLPRKEWTAEQRAASLNPKGPV